MKPRWKTMAKIGHPVALCLLFSLAPAQDRGTGQSGPGASPGGGQQRRIGGDYVDDRVQLREYHFKIHHYRSAGGYPEFHKLNS